jgi:peptidoglycan/LPS O-acetylase OafA/YrhL
MSADRAGDGTDAKTDNMMPLSNSRRIFELDGLRGLMTIMVILSHYFGELRHGLRIAMVGWIAVDMFFVLSGFLIGRLILERQYHANFFSVFYIRRFCRTIPPYVVTILVVVLLNRLMPAWTDAETQFPLWSYLTFVQGGFMVVTHSIGEHWLAPTWTLAVEEHFYLLVPSLIVFSPRRWLVPELILIAVGAVILRMAVIWGGHSQMLIFALLPGRADILVCGLLAAVAIHAKGINWAGLIPALRILPLVALVACLLLKIAASDEIFGTFSPLVIAVGCAAYLLGIVHGVPEARRFKSKVLQFFGNNGYCLYLTHLPILGLAHWLILGSKPDLATPAQWLVTLAALPVCVLVGWGMTKLIEEPLTEYGRSWRWSPRSASSPGLRRGRTSPAVDGPVGSVSA